MNKVNLGIIGTLFALVSTVAGGIFFLDDRYAMASEHEVLEKRVNLNELQYLKQDALKNKYFYKEQMRKYPDDEDLKKQLEETEEELKEIKEQIKKIRTQ